MLQFSLPRFITLLKRDAMTIKRSYLLSCLAVILILCLPIIVVSYNANSSFRYFEFQSILSTALLFGIIWASLSFIELNQTTTKQFYLSIPASNFEKILSKYLLTILITFGFLILYICVSYLFTFGNNNLSNVKTNYLSIDWDLLSNTLLPSIVAITIYYAGSAWMPKNSIFKTTFGLIVLLFIIAIIIFIIAKIVFYDYFTGYSISINENMNFNLNQIKLIEYIWLKNSIMICIIIFCLALSFFKLKEKEL